MRDCEQVRLDDGTEVELRPIRAADAPLLQSGFLRLSERTRYLRFHGARTELTAEELRYLAEVDGERHVALIAFTAPGEMAGVGQFVRATPLAPDAEVALVVADDLQGKGLGRALLSRLWKAARARNIGRFTGLVLEENRTMRRFLHQLGARVGLASYGVCEIELPLI